MKIVSWNVNGLRALMKKQGFEFIRREKPDVLCIQETKLQPGQVEGILPQYPFQFWSYAEKKGYSGTALFSKTEPLSVRYGMNSKQHDREGRLTTAEYDAFYLVDVYTPNAQRGLARLEYRIKWDRAFLRYLKGLEKHKPVVFCGDLNVAHEEIDLARPAGNRGNAGFTDQERHGFSRLLKAGFIDSFRELHSEGGHYTWWSYIYAAREKNIGWRIDYVGLSEPLRERLKEAYILPDVMGSDHCPIGAVID